MKNTAEYSKLPSYLSFVRMSYVIKNHDAQVEEESGVKM